MALREDFEKIGNWFFRWRSFLPLLLVFLFLIAIKSTWYSRYMDVYDRLWEFFSVFVAMLGLAIRIYAVGSAPRNTSGRNVKEQRAASINTTGLYSLVRHPLYLGNFLMWFGIALFVRAWWLPLLVTFVFWFYYEKIMYAEEEFLRKEFGSEFTEWADQTPAFFPWRPQLWKPPALEFSFRNALRREYSGFFAVIALCSLIKLAQDWIAWNRIHLDLVWFIIFIVGLAIYLSLMYLKRKTNLLNVPGH